MSENSIEFCFTMSDLEDPKDFANNLRKTIEKGLKKIYALTQHYKIVGADNIQNFRKGKKQTYIQAPTFLKRENL